jgi:hypothetical protein
MYGLFAGLLLCSMGHAEDGWPDVSAPTRKDVALQEGVDAAIAIERDDQAAEAGRMSEAELTSEAQTINLWTGTGYGLLGAGVVVGVGIPLFLTVQPGGIRITGRW